MISNKLATKIRLVLAIPWFHPIIRDINFWLRIQSLFPLVFATFLSGSFSLIEPYTLQYIPVEYEIPSQSDWVDYGKIFEAGDLGDWDYQLFGGFTNSSLKRDGAYYLFYQGASGYRTTPDDTVTWRAIGVATSPDGINFTKANNNPVITWFPNDSGEEGAVSAGTALDDQGNIVVHYGANTEASASLVNADVRAALSTDGINFKDIGTVIQHGDKRIWGSRDEIFPIMSIHDGDRWVVYYLPNGIIGSGMLGAAWGDKFDNLTRSSRAGTGFLPVAGWGTGSPVEIAQDTYALFISNVRSRTIQVHLMSLNDPAQLSFPVESYSFDEVLQASIYLDKETQTWFMFYRADGYYGVKIAPANKIDRTPPSVSGGVQATPLSDTSVELRWKPASDPETGIAVYKVFRNREEIAVVKGWNYEDTGLHELSTHTYQIQAVNYHGVEGSLSEVLSVETLADTSEPHIISVAEFQDRVTLTFDEPLDKASAEVTANYEIIGGVSLLDAVLDETGYRVTLTSRGHKPNTAYTLKVRNIFDRADAPNRNNGERIRYISSSIPGLAGAWNFEEGTGDVANDWSNYGNHGELTYLGKPGPSWVEGIVGSALRFDGLDDQVRIPLAAPLLDTFRTNYSISLWVKPLNTPINDSPNNQYYSIINFAEMGLSYQANNQFSASVSLENGVQRSVWSDTYQPGQWHHLVMVVDATEQFLRLYVDGREADRSPQRLPGSILAPSNGYILIGTANQLEGRYENRLEGIVDQVKIYATALTADQAFSLYQNERP